MKKKIVRKSTRKRTWVVLLSNHTDHRDDDSIQVQAASYNEAVEAARGKFDSSRYSIRTAMTLAESKKNWA